MKENIKDTLRRYIDSSLKDYLTNIIVEYEKIGDNPLYGIKSCGSDAENRGSQYIADELRRIGITDVEMIPVKTDRFQFNDATIKIVGEEYEIKPCANISPGTEKDGITAELVDIGGGAKESFTDELAGKIIMIDGGAGEMLIHQLMEIQRLGAAGAVIYSPEKMVSDDDLRVYPLLKPEITILSISNTDAGYLQGKLAEGKVFINMWADIDYRPNEGITYEVVAEIKGKTDERIILTSHLDHYFRCIQDNMTSVATLLGIAKRMVDMGYKPNRTITFMFNGSHELGNSTMFPPDFRGCQTLMDMKSDWTDKIYANINFEYTGLSLNTLSAISSFEMIPSYEEFVKYMPKSMPGFNQVAETINPELAAFGTWTDSAVFMTRGIPYVLNDSVSEQMMTGTSPYLNRDHSTSDNWDAFSGDAIDGVTAWYGAYIMFLDMMPYGQIDFTHRAAAMALTAEEKQGFDMTIGRLSDKLAAHIGEFGEAAAALSAYTKLQNETYDEISERSEIFNRKLYGITRKVGLSLDYSTSTTFSLLMMIHKICAARLSVLLGAMEAISNKDTETFYGQLIPYMDIAPLTAFISKETAGKVADIMVETHNDTWLKGRLLTVNTFADVIEAVEKGDYEGAGRVLSGEIEKEVAETVKATESLINALSEITDEMRQLARG